MPIPRLPPLNCNERFRYAIACSTVEFYTQASLAGSAFFITANTSIPAGVTLNIIDKSSQYYLEENTSLGISAATANIISVTCSYEDIS